MACHAIPYNMKYTIQYKNTISNQYRWVYHKAQSLALCFLIFLLMIYYYDYDYEYEIGLFGHIIFNIFILYIIKVQHFLHTTLHTIQRKRKGL